MLEWTKPTYRRQATKDGRYWVEGTEECRFLRQGWWAMRADLDEAIVYTLFPTRWEAKEFCEKDAEKSETNNKL